MKFSIITPTFNRGDLIERAIQSILSQTYANWEMIIVDDASTDDTSEIIKKYFEDKRIKYVVCKNNLGVNKARNLGFKNISSDSEVITFLDSDDEFLPSALADMMQEINEFPEINSFRFGVQYTNGQLVHNPKHNLVVADFNYYIQNLFTIGEWVCSFRKKVIDEGFQYSKDVQAFEFISYISLSQKEVLFFSDKIVRIYHTGHESISSEKPSQKSIENAINGYEMILYKYGKKIKEVSRKNFAALNYLLGNILITSKKKKRGFLFTLHGFKNDPLNIRFYRNIFNLLFK